VVAYTALPRSDDPSGDHGRQQPWRIIPDDMSSPSLASLAHRGGAMLNFALTEFSEDEMRRPTPCTQYPWGLQMSDGL